MKKTKLKKIKMKKNHKKAKLLEGNVKIYVRRGGPNYQSGLQMMLDCAQKTGLHIEVFGPETHLTSVVAYALVIKVKFKKNKK